MNSSWQILRPPSRWVPAKLFHGTLLTDPNLLLKQHSHYFLGNTHFPLHLSIPYILYRLRRVFHYFRWEILTTLDFAKLFVN